MNADQIDQKMTQAKRKLQTVNGRIRRLDSKKAFVPELSYLTARHHLEVERAELAEYIKG